MGRTRIPARASIGRFNPNHLYTEVQPHATTTKPSSFTTIYKAISALYASLGW